MRMIRPATRRNSGIAGLSITTKYKKGTQSEVRTDFAASPLPAVSRELCKIVGAVKVYAQIKLQIS